MANENVKPQTIEQRLQAAHKKLLGEFPDLEGIVTNLFWKSTGTGMEPVGGTRGIPNGTVSNSEPIRTILTPRTSGDDDINLGFFLGLSAAGIQLIELSTTTLAHAVVENKEIKKIDLSDDVEM